MAAKVIREFAVRQVVMFERAFELISDAGSRYSFLCDAQGNILGDDYRTKEEREAQVLEVSKDPLYKDLGVISWTRKVKDCKVIECEECHQPVYLAYSENDCDCGKKRYNLFGQSLRMNYTKVDEMEEFSYGDWNNEGY